jgi:hypothetical protein
LHVLSTPNRLPRISFVPCAWNPATRPNAAR